MKPPECRSCGAVEWRHVCAGAVSAPSRVTSKVVVDAAIVKPVKPAEPARSNRLTWRERDPEAYRTYMREYMARRRAARRVQESAS